MITARVGDVLSFARMHLSGGLAADGTQVLSAASAGSMAEKHADLPDTRTLGDSWGLGWIRYGWDGERLIGHDGNTIGQSAFLSVLPAHGLAVSLLTNGGSARDLYHALWSEIFRETVGVRMPAPLEPPASPPEFDPARYVGRYERSGITTEVTEQDGGLTLRATVTGPLAELVPKPVHEYPLVPVEPDVFALKDPAETTWTAVTFYEIAGGARYVHYGARANPLVDGALAGVCEELVDRRRHDELEARAAGADRLARARRAEPRPEVERSAGRVRLLDEEHDVSRRPGRAPRPQPPGSATVPRRVRAPSGSTQSDTSCTSAGSSRRKAPTTPSVAPPSSATKSTLSTPSAASAVQVCHTASGSRTTSS